MDQNFANLLRKKKFRATKGRIKLLKVIAAKNSAISFPEFVELLKDQMDRATVFRILDSFNSAGILHRFSDIDGTMRYAMCEFEDCDHSKHHDEHMHFYCKKCNRVICLTNVNFPNIQLPVGFELNHFSINGVGLCKTCNLS